MAKASTRPVSLDHIREKVLKEHEHIRNLLITVRVAVDAAEATPEDEVHVRSLRGQLRHLVSFMRRHLAMEERFLQPVLPTLDAWGTARMERMRADHQQQRAMLHAIAAEVRLESPHLDRLCGDARWFIDALHEDMASEETALVNDTVLSDAVVSSHQELG